MSPAVPAGRSETHLLITWQLNSGKWNETKTYPTGKPVYSKPAHATAGAGKAATVAGAGLAGIVGLAAFVL